MDFIAHHTNNEAEGTDMNLGREFNNNFQLSTTYYAAAREQKHK